MDKDQDILFLYLTTHGSADHVLSFDQSGMDLPDLSADELGQVLDDSGIKWKVVVLSACYSGGFIDRRIHLFWRCLFPSGAARQRIL